MPDGQTMSTTAPMPTPVILLTGFEPFGGDSLNPSWQVALALNGAVVAGGRVVSVCLPCRFGESLLLLKQALRAHRPTLVLCLGLAASRTELSLERVAINVDDARMPDNAGQQPIDQPVVAGAPAAYFTRLPIKAIVQGLQARGLPAGVSQSAGTFVCNHVFFGLMHALRRRSQVRAGFMHLPLLPEMQTGPTDSRFSLALAQQVDGVRQALALALNLPADLPLTQGALA
jgi:pyroglutamyl-peptidase